MGNLILIRHSVPEVSEKLPPEKWHLSPEGLARCTWLAESLQVYFPKTIYHSPEVKAHQTAEETARLMGCKPVCWLGLHEHVRSVSHFIDQADFESRLRAFFEHPGELVFGNETADEAFTRFSDAVDALTANIGPSSDHLLIVSHGTVISLFASRRYGVEAFSFWQQLKMPSYVVISRQEHLLGDIVKFPDI